MTVTDRQVLTERLDLEMLERPHLWSTQRRGMRCVFVKRGTGAGLGKGETGPCFRLQDGSYQVMAFDWSNAGALTARPYESAEAVYNDGWRVD